MTKYKVNLEIAAENQEQLQEKLQAFQDLVDNLEHDDLIQAVDVVVENPELVDFIKEVSPEDGKELSVSDYLGIAKKAYQRFG